MSWFEKIPTMERQELRDLKKYIDISFKDFSRTYGDGIESFFDPLLYFLVWFEKLLINAPWPLIIFVIAVLAWIGSRNIFVIAGTVSSFLLIGYFGMWEDTMSTLAIISICTLLCISIGIPIGIFMARSDRLQSIVNPAVSYTHLTLPTTPYV